MQLIVGVELNRLLTIDVRKRSTVEHGPLDVILTQSFDAAQYLGFDQSWFGFEHHNTLAAGQYPIVRGLIDGLNQAEVRYGHPSDQSEDIGDLSQSAVGWPHGDESDG